ncbi:MAG: DMT family transporter [bacterium]
MSKSRKLAYSALLFNAVIWGAAFPIIKPAFDLISPMQYLYLRFLVAGIISLPIVIWYYIKEKPSLTYIFKVLLIELLGITIPLFLLYEGLNQTSALEASLLGSIAPLFIVIGSMWFLKEKESQREWQGLALALIGSLILILDPILNGYAITGSNLKGNLLIMGYNLTYTMYAIIAKKIYKKKPPIFLGSLTYLTTALIYGVILFSKQSLPSLSLLSIPTVLLPVLYMAIPGGILAFGLHLFAVSKIEVSEANLFTYLNGVVAIPVSALLLHEYPTFITLLAVIFITWGVIRAEAKKSTHR